MPARQVLHTIATANFYCRDKQPETVGSLAAGYWGRDLDWGGTATEELPNQAEVRGYLEHVGQRGRQWIESKSDMDWLAEQGDFAWTGPNLLSRSIYLIRHIQGHIGEINAELRRRGLERVQWVA